jgi:hypothetical protein
MIRFLRAALPRWRFLGVAFSYCAIVAAGTSALLTRAVVFLSYSDRPGPGWQGFHWPPLTELFQICNFFGGWAWILALASICTGFSLALLALLFWWLFAPNRDASDPASVFCRGACAESS